MDDQSVTVLILAGGQSWRMGQDKVWLALDGQPLVERVARRLLPMAAEIIFSTNTPGPFAALIERLPIPARTVLDQHPATGPLAGLHAGLAASTCDLVLAVAADMPFVNLALMRRLVRLAPGFDAVVPRLPARATGRLEWEPLHALYRRSCLPWIAARLADAERRAASFFGDVAVRTVLAEEIAPLDPGLLSFSNVNTPEDWRSALARLAGPSAGPAAG